MHHVPLHSKQLGWCARWYNFAQYVLHLSLSALVSFFYSLLSALMIFFFLVFLPTLLERQGFQLYCSWAVLPHELLGVISVWAFSFEVTQPSGLPEDKQLHFQLQS